MPKIVDAQEWYAGRVSTSSVTSRLGIGDNGRTGVIELVEVLIERLLIFGMDLLVSEMDRSRFNATTGFHR